MSLFYIWLILFPVLAVSLAASVIVLRRNWVASHLLREGKIDQALQLMPSHTKKTKLAHRLLCEGQVAQGLYIFQRVGDHNYIKTYIHDHLQIPGKFTEVEVKGWFFTRKETRRSDTADLLYNAATKLLVLKENINAMNNPYIPETLKNDLRVGLDDGFFILWDTCHRLSLIEIQKLPVEERSLQAARDEIGKLIDISDDAQRELGQLTLERDATRMRLYQNAFRRFSEEAREIRDARQLLSSLEN
ncbi:MAG TPA: hypothetical protein VGO96_04265 [Pyrinomonadaceae bacterium]|jgi:hypothetical protein|nr:hypothetical protein [Pyrinomonadaceae bacterium]